MPIDPKTITVFLDASPSGTRRAAYAISLAQRWHAHLVGIYVIFAGVTLPASLDYARGKKAIEDAIAFRDQMNSDAEAVAAGAGENFRVLCAEQDVSEEFGTIGRDNSAAEAIRIALHSDLVVVGHPEVHGLPDDLPVEKLLLASGAPVLLVPNAWQGGHIGNNILIGWNASRAARRAISDAMAFLIAAESVTVLVIDPDSLPHGGKDPGADIVRHLARHGVHANLALAATRGTSIITTMLDYVARNASDLLIVGAYSHARMKEFLVGGTTRTLLAQTPLPTLLSR